VKVRLTATGLIFVLAASTAFLSLRAERKTSNGAAHPLIFPPPLPIGFLFEVTSTGDGDNVGAGGICDDGTGNCTLRAAIQAANASPGDDSIRFNIPTTDPGFESGRWFIRLSKALPDISNINIEGPGPDKLIVQRFVAMPFRIFNVTTNGTASFSGISILSGQAVNDSGGGVQNVNDGTVNITNCALSDNSVFVTSGLVRFGGAIYNKATGTVTLSNSMLTNNSAENGGGAIRNENGTLNVTSCSFSNNSTPDGAGGGIQIFAGTCTVLNSTFRDNSATGPSIGSGGGIANHNGTLTVTNCTFSHNFAAGSGGGAITNDGSLSLTNSTLSANFAAADGGAIRNTSTAAVINCTVTGNSVISGSGVGGGVFQDFQGPTMVKGTIVALNSASSGPDISGTFISGGFNLIGKVNGGSGFAATTDNTGTINAPLDPLLSPNGLQDNGGSTQTIALQAGSPAINAGPVDAPSTDQRGFARIGQPDIGAFEFAGTNFTQFLGNISTRGFVGTSDNVMIGGFVISGREAKSVLLRAIGPSLANPPFHLSGTLQDPTLSLFRGSTVIVSNDNWKDRPNSSFIPIELQPTNDSESAIFTALLPGAYTAIVSGVNNGTGIGLVEVYDMDQTTPSKLVNISTRGFVQTGDNVLIGGFIVNGQDPEKLVVRAIGPSLADPPFSLTNVLQNPTLSLFDANGMVFASNDDWRSIQEADIMATGLRPSNDAESAIVTTLIPGNYTAIVRGANSTTGIALVEVYD
jgi:hypothetical protein